MLNPNNRAFKGTGKITNKSCTDGGNPTKNLIFEWPVTLRNYVTLHTPEKMQA